jgi:hypothetical protein
LLPFAHFRIGLAAIRRLLITPIHRDGGATSSTHSNGTDQSVAHTASRVAIGRRRKL